MEFRYVHHAGVVIAVFFEERLHQCRRDSSAARDGKMGRPGPLLDRQIAGQRSLIDALVQLKEMRVGVTNADPEDVRRGREVPAPGPCVNLDPLLAVIGRACAARRGRCMVDATTNEVYGSRGS